MPPTVSINLCCYNSEKYLEETLQSIFAQTYKNWELVIINDGSTDATEQIIQRHIAEGWPIVYHYQANAGLGRSRNKAIELSKGEFIAFIDHDDLWMSQKLERQISLFADPKVGLVYSDAIYFNEGGYSHRLYQSRAHYTGRCFQKLLIDYFLCLQTVVIRKESLSSLIDLFDPRFKMSEEVDLFARIAYKWKFAIVNEPLAKWRVHSSSLTWKFGVQFSEELDMMLKKFEKIIPDFSSKYVREIAFLRQQNVISKAMFMWRDGKNNDARRILFPLLHHRFKACIVFAFTFFPESIIGRLLTPFRKTKISPSGF